MNDCKEILALSKKAADEWRDDHSFYQAAVLIDSLCSTVETLLKKLDGVKEERDAAIEDIPHTCEYCAYNGVDADSAPCADCERMNTLFGEERWEWRGMKEG